MFDLANDQRVAKLVSDFARSSKMIAAVCHGPAALVGATQANGTPLVQGKRLTAFSDSEEVAVGLQDAAPFSLEQRLIGLGANFSQGRNFGEYVIEDRNLITGQNPQSSAKAAEFLLARLNNSGTHSSNWPKADR
jgi:putative intracellular protease/amidase